MAEQTAAAEVDGSLTVGTEKQPDVVYVVPNALDSVTANPSPSTVVERLAFTEGEWTSSGHPLNSGV